MNVLVTGATGFVGGHLVNHLLDRGDTVTALVRSPSRATALAGCGVRMVTGDLSNSAALADAVAGVDVVYHAAAMLGAPLEAQLMAVNRDGTRMLADACRSSGTSPRLVLVSSMAAGGPSSRGMPKTGSGDDRPVTMYGRSKLAAEQVLESTAIRWTVLRPPVVYGPGDLGGFLPLFKAARFGIAPTFGDGSMEVSLVHVSDLADAIVRAGTAPDVEGRTFYVNHPEILTGAGIVRSIALAMGRDPVRVRIPRWAAQAALGVTGTWAEWSGQKSILHPDKLHEFYQAAWTADPSAFVAATGWQPTMTLEQGLVGTTAWYRTAGLL